MSSALVDVLASEESNVDVVTTYDSNGNPVTEFKTTLKQVKTQRVGDKIISDSKTEVLICSYKGGFRHSHTVETCVRDIYFVVNEQTPILIESFSKDSRSEESVVLVDPEYSSRERNVIEAAKVVTAKPAQPKTVKAKVSKSKGRGARSIRIATNQLAFPGF